MMSEISYLMKKKKERTHDNKLTFNSYIQKRKKKEKNSNGYIINDPSQTIPFSALNKRLE